MKRIWGRVTACVLAAATIVTPVVLTGSTGFDNFSSVRNLAAVAPGAHQTLNTTANEGCPAVSPDGLSMYLASNRDGTLDIWRSRRQSTQQAWGAPEKLPPIINKADSNEFCPTPFGDGSNLLFVSNKAGGCQRSVNRDGRVGFRNDEGGESGLVRRDEEAGYAPISWTLRY